MKITYIHHSSFLVETEAAYLLFDYFQGKLPEISQEKPLYVFASHRHPDHFSKVIFELEEQHPDIHYILAFDIWSKRVPDPCKDKTEFLKPGQVLDDGRLKVEGFKSTDEGVAFWCTVDGLEIYPAGDLNHWYWDGEDSQWNKNMTKAYREEIAKMHGRTADAAFLPLDPRLGEYFYLGIDDFMKEVDAKHIFPMHFWGEYDVAERLKQLPCSAGYRDRVVEIHEEGESWEI